MLQTGLDPIVGIGVSVGIGLVLVVIAFAVVKRSATLGQWKVLGMALGIAVLATAIGLLVSLLSVPESPPYEPAPVATALAAVALPGVLLMNVFGRHSLDAIPYFGGFVLNIAMWSTIAYAVLQRVRRA